ncbi:MAG: hypothetical protein Q8938_16205, partial [Bacteroidota bacterium]|nr:hypothetical protein [Bacteroidota bacterium]
ALRIYMHNVSNKDSLQKALILLDSAIFLRKDKNFYTNKYIVARRLGQYTLALASCDSILAVDHNDFFATLHKGYIFEDMNHTDSQNSYYSKAYSLLDSSRAWQSANMVRDREKIILKGLLKDTVAYRQMVDVFIVKYDTSKVYKGIANEFSTFDRDRFLERF